MSPQPPAAGPSVDNKVKKDKKDKKAKKEKEGTKEQSTSSTQPPTVSTPAFSSLFGGSVDPNLDSVFAQSSVFAITPVLPPPPPPPRPISKPSAPVPSTTAPSSQNKRKHEEEEDEVPTSAPGLRKPGKKPRPAKDGPPKAKAKSSEKEVEVEEQVEDEDEDNDDLEMSYAAKKSGTSTVPSQSAPRAVEEESDSGEEFVHETLAKESKPKAKKDRGKKKEKWVPEGETSEDRDKRTIFVGNVDVEVVKNKSALNKFQAHLLSFAPSASIESVRFRSIAFAQPTSAMPTEEGSKEAEKEEARRIKREIERAKRWREEQEKEERNGVKPRGGLANDRLEEEADDKKGDKVYLMPGEKRKVAFIKRDFHAEGSSANAYVVFAYNPPTRSVNVPPILDPFIAATQIIAKANGSTFMDRLLRLDAVRPTLSNIIKAAAEEGKSTLPAKREAWTKGSDPKCSLFVGSLDYNTKEEDLRVFFEGLVKTERGARPLGEGEQVTVEGTRWVSGVRLIRDRETQLGKGFGYIAFSDRECVDEILAMPSEKLKFAKRSLRVQPCKSLPPSLGGAATSLPKPKPVELKKSDGKRTGKPAYKPTPVAIKIPKGDPKLGEKLASLSKDERKVAKSSDADRLARRLAKKQSLKAKSALADKNSRVKLDVRSNRKDGMKKIKAKKSRVRSENAAKNVKGKRD